MATWFVKLGDRDKNDLREPLANEHSLIMISYSLRKDVSKMEDAELRKQIQIDNPGAKENVIGAYLRHLRLFKDKINPGDCIISPFNMLAGGKVRVGIATGECSSLELLLGEEFKGFAKYYPKANECSQMLTRRVKWITEFTDKEFLDKKTLEKIIEVTSAIFGTVNQLN